MSYFNNTDSGDIADRFYAQTRGPECDSCDDDPSWARAEFGTAGCPDCGAGDETDTWADMPEDAAMESSLFGDC